MKELGWFALLWALLGVTSVRADDWKTAWDGTLYGYAGHVCLNDDSVVNPGNQLARLPRTSATAEARFNLSAESGGVRLSARPIALVSKEHNDFGRQQRNEGYLSQWQARLRQSEILTLAIGRQILNWGAGQFRSPSSPFYFDNGRNNPMRELSGVDALQLAWTPNVNTALTIAHVSDSGHAAPSPESWRDTWLLKWDQRGTYWAAGLVLAQASGKTPFVGVHAQQTLDDAWLLYGEAGSGTRGGMLVSPSDLAHPFQLQAKSKRLSSWLFGAAYTFESGQSLHAEWLRDEGGYTREESAAYFSRAAASQANAALAVSNAPRLLNRNYLHLVWQSNLMAEDGYARLMFTRNLGDGGNEFAGYAERVLSPRVSAFCLASLTTGGERTEFARLFSRSVTAGIKIAIP